MNSFYNRDRVKLWIDDNGYLQADKKYTLEYMRVGYDRDPNDIQFIDPSGGPMIEVGSKLCGKIVSAIMPDENGWKILFK